MLNISMVERMSTKNEPIRGEVERRKKSFCNIFSEEELI